MSWINVLRPDQPSATVSCPTVSLDAAVAMQQHWEVLGIKVGSSGDGNGALRSLFSVSLSQECVDRAESRWNKAWNDDWNLVLINWFSTAANPLQPCLNSFKEIKEKLVTCHGKFGLWANFVAVNYYAAGSGGGAFQAVSWLNNMFRRK